MKKHLAILIALLGLVSFTRAQPGVIAPSDNLVAQGIPKIPASLAADVARYTEFRQAALYSWHPRTREMLIGTRLGDSTQVHLLKSPGGARNQLTFFPDSVPGAVFDPFNGRSFVFSKDSGGNEAYQNYRFDMESGQSTLLTDGKSRNSSGFWASSCDGRFAYTSTRRTGKHVDLYLVNPLKPTSDHLFAKFNGGGWQVLGWSHDDTRILLLEYVSINETHLWIVDTGKMESKAMQITPRSGPKVAYLHACFAGDDKGLYVTSDCDGEFQQLAHLDIVTGNLTPLTKHIPWDVTEFALSSDGGTLAFVTNEEGVGVLRLLDTASDKELPRPILPAGNVSKLKWRPQPYMLELGFNLVSARHPMDVFSLIVPTGKLVRWTESETGGLNTDNFAEPQLIRWKSFDGLSISGFLYRPPAKFTGKRPVIIDIHGGPESQFRPTFLGRKNYFLNEMGVAIIFPNIRGSAGYGKSFLKLDNGYLRPGAYKDIGALLDWIATQPDLDPERIMVTGGSYGGHMTLAVATLFNDRIRCSVDVVGISNLVTMLKNTADYRRDLRRAEYGDERDEKMRKFLEEIAPLNHAHKITKPLFVVQGKNDPRVPYTESEQMVATVRKNKTPVWYLLANDEGHGFAKKRNADFQFYATVMFMREHLLPVASEDKPMPSAKTGADVPADKTHTNWLGMKLVHIEPGRFKMGTGDAAPATRAEWLERDEDEAPAHDVAISRPFFMGAFEVTNAQYQHFDPAHTKRPGPESDTLPVTNVTWQRAVDFCAWLSKKEGLPYRLPTEAEWEYACRAGTTTPYHTGATLSAEQANFGLGKDGKTRIGARPVGSYAPNAWGLYDMHGNVAEWCLDWHGAYAGDEQVDPMGRADGHARVVRGWSYLGAGYQKAARFCRAANRSGHLPEDSNRYTGFRIVLGERPRTKPLPAAEAPLNQRNVLQGPAPTSTRDPAKPFFIDYSAKKANPTIPPQMFGPIFSEHNHFSSVCVCPNGDVLAVWYTCVGESDRQLAQAASRLRAGSERWEPASFFFGTPDVNTHAPVLLRDGQRIYHFCTQSLQGWDSATNIMRTSDDSGATWSKPTIILRRDDPKHLSQPCSAFVAKDGTLVLACDGDGHIDERIMFSKDKGKTWTVAGGDMRKSVGKYVAHPAVVERGDGAILCFLRGPDPMPLLISRDLGESWEVQATPFSGISVGQKVMALRLTGGGIALFTTERTGKVASTVLALSLDDGKTWPHVRKVEAPVGGYKSLAQNENGIIYLIGSRMKFAACNEAWLREGTARNASKGPETGK